MRTENVEMESTPPQNKSEPRSDDKSASRLAKPEEPSRLIVELAPSPQLVNLSPKPQSPLYIHELLLLSPSPHRRSRTRLAERLELASEDPVDLNGSRRRCKSRTSASGLAGCASPRNGRRLRRRLEPEIREDKDVIMTEVNNNKPRKRRNTGRSKKEKPSLVPLKPSPMELDNDDEGINLDQLGQVFTDLVMWNDVAKSSLWFGLGSLCFLSSCFTQGIQFSIFSFSSQVALLCLGISFISTSICQRNNVEKREIKLKEDDIVRAARLVLPVANLVLSTTRGIFSGEPSTTLKVAPILLLGAQYGHLITLWRLCVLGFFASFTGPKLYSRHSIKIKETVNNMKSRLLKTWGACSHKKIVAGSLVTAFWNLTTVKTRIFAAFLCLVMIRYCRQFPQFPEAKPQEEEEQEVEHERALVLVEKVSKKA